MSQTYDLGDWVRDHEAEVRQWPAITGPGPRPCLVDDCGRAVFAAGLCQAHRLQARRLLLSQRRNPG